MTRDDILVTVRARCAAACRIVLRLSVAGMIAWTVHLLMDWVANLELFADNRLPIGILAVFLLAYALLMAVPFVPGIEIGLTLMVMEGSPVAPFVYLSTVLGLSLAYAAGEWLPHARLHRLFEDLRLKRACGLLEAVEPLDRGERLDALRASAPAWLRPVASRYRYVMLAVLVNMPGNAFIGGGGAIFFTAGLSRLFLPAQTVLTIVFAVAPVPLAVWAFGIDLGSYLD
jgi:hypothetical protein